MSFDTSGEAPEIQIYTPGERSAVTVLVIAGVLSISAVASGCLYYFVFSKRTKTFHRTNLAPYLVSLLLANVLQAIATILNARWVREGIVFDGSFCSFQGGLKNAANVGTALWSFIIALHVFNLLFLRWKTTCTGMIITLICGWTIVAFIVTLGPLAIETPERGPYFGVSGYWCWITDNYPKEQTYMEYFIEFISAGLGFILYTLVLLRVRGNLIIVNGRWHLRWITRSQAWQLSFARDLLDTAMLHVATNMVWYAVAYSLIIIPVAIARLSSFTGHHVPFWATIMTDTIFNLTGLVNAILFVYTRRILPDTASLPQFTTPRSRMSDSEAMFGVTPFTPGATHSTGSSEENDKKDEADWDANSTESSHLTVAPRNLLDQGLESKSDTGYGIGVRGFPDRDSVSYPDVVTLPSLAFAYPGRTTNQGH
ncbi:uncharacterized protein FOMMEDRAFT_103454 [Fomitiporia mediterranea MF3/22]|uniref:uncharacterized protein n=1 Tax=Fomitiporia mediterranea (strain MF3/22) TaxID=694068 RepID=UPI0004408A85|nr:uncharacterized protein FOMMEDRAFT_103454 [Fomitiporia mediterranea MF3/22]EJD05423.1 hypothetical protein FOMMEDRAFT_103454 [Fomitiporia mediterranea MF3/22]